MNSHTKGSVKPQEHYKLNPLKNKDGWCISDFSLDSTDRIVLSGSKHTTRETFIKVFSVTHSDVHSKPKCLYSRDFNRQENPEQWRLVSFMDNFNLVTCYDNQIDKISLRNDKIVQSKKLTNNGASCISVKGTKIFIGFSKSSCIAVLSSNLHQTSTIKLSALQDGWPVDLIMVPDTILVCSFGCVPRRALSFTEKDGQLLREYTNPRSDDSVPLSLTVSVEADLVAILWNSPPQLTIHSFSHGHCLVVADVEPAERIRSVGQDKLVMVDEKGEMKVFQMGQFFTMHNLKATLLCLLSCEDCKELGDFFGLPFNQSKQTDSSTSSPSETVIEDDQYPEGCKLDFFWCLEKNNKICNGDVTDLMRCFKQLKKGRTILDPLEAYEKYRGDCESRYVLDSAGCGTSQERDVNERNDAGANQEPSGDEDDTGDDASASQELDVDERGDVGSKRKHSRDDQLLTNGSSKRKRIERNKSNADNEPQTLDQVGLVESIKRAVTEAVDPLLTEIQSLKQQNDLMMCYLRTQPLQHSSCLHCSCFHQCQPLLAHPCSQVHTHACNHLVQPCANGHMQVGNGVPPNSQPNLPQHSQQQSFAPLPPYQSIVNHPQVVSYPNPPFHVQPYRQLLPPQPTQLQTLPNYYPNHPVNLPPPNLRQTTAMTQPSSQSSSQHPLPNTGLQTPVQAHTMHLMQGYHTPGLNGTTDSTDGFSSPPSLQAVSNVPPQGATQSTPNQQLPAVPQDSSRPSGEYHSGTLPSTMSTPTLQAPNDEEVLVLPGLPTESSPALGQEGGQGVSSSGQEVKIPTKLSDLPKSIQLKLLPCNGQKSEQDRQSVTKILLKYFFTHNERLNGNTSGKYGYRQLRRDKLLGMRDLIFKICPLDGEEGEMEKEKEWSELCKLIDVTNRRYRNELKRGGRSKKKLQPAKS
ncbi:hypothetical protein HOLleu_21150 [Holothuria leucospilota]|uniref:Uncharacterized protein n=1 Tax=Holothuria leucospilota TaxID=206669 RepID=A0A9Q1BXF7_HOLLE|nr:hypothetical protein HOLleu_21150 [Holothuria leucospilota]